MTAEPPPRPAEESKIPLAPPGRFRAALGIYGKPRVLALLFLGFASGLPLALTGQTLVVWMAQSGVTLTVIGLFSLVGLPYVLKFLWAPAFDRIALPGLAPLLGRRRSWLIATELALVVAIAALGASTPGAHPAQLAVLALVVAFCSASQDTVIDAFRVESLREEEQAAGMANYVAGYRIALLVATAGAFEIASRLQHAGFPGRAGWQLTYDIMAALMAAGVITVLFSREPNGRTGAAQRGAVPMPLLRRLKAAVADPFLDFLTRPAWLAILLFVVLFKLSDAMAGAMTAPFVLALGFSKVDFGRVVKLFGFGATLLGGYAGGSLQRLLGLRRGLWLGGLAQMLALLAFVWLAAAGHNLPVLAAVIALTNFTDGLGTVIFVAYLSALCENRDYTATQYALLSALAAVGRTIFSAATGWIAATTGWSHFFLLSMLAGIPGLLLLWRIGHTVRESRAFDPSPGQA